MSREEAKKKFLELVEKCGDPGTSILATRYIPATPTLGPEDSAILVKDLQNCCDEEEMSRRVENARKRLDQTTKKR